MNQSVFVLQVVDGSLSSCFWTTSVIVLRTWAKTRKKNLSEKKKEKKIHIKNLEKILEQK